MSSDVQVKDRLIRINERILALIQQAEDISELSDPGIQEWASLCRRIQRQIDEETIRVAVVGSIKSGKSTFLNALFQGDFVKRGAGVVTSIVTRVRAGRSLRAKLLFKSWDEVNADMQQAMVLFPAIDPQASPEPFDIRRSKDRTMLQQALSQLGSDHLITNDARNVNSVLLFSYLKGYERVRQIVSSDPVTLEFAADDFSQHRDFVGEEFLAVYLKDIELEINSAGIDSNIEIADCQGSDSPNPLHLAMIQDYLLLTHFIVYVISSRIGLRRADIKFLSIIKKMGILDNMIFVLNCDFSEHESRAAFEALSERVREEIELIKPEPLIFRFSALYHLFRSGRDELTEKDAARLQYWEKDPALIELSEAETRSFQSAFRDRFTGKRYALLLRNHLERQQAVLEGIGHWVRMSRDILGQDVAGAREMIDRTQAHQNRIEQIKSLIKRTLDGAVPGIRDEMKKDIDGFFDARSGKILRRILRFIQNYNLNTAKYEENLENAGFNNTLYLIFQEFRQALDAYMAETVNPEVIRFAIDVEDRVESYFNGIAGPYDAMVEEALYTFRRQVAQLEIAERFSGNAAQAHLPDMDSIKRISGLKIPALVTNMRYSARIRTEGILRFGFFKLLRNFKKLLRKPVGKQSGDAFRALEGAVKRIQRETEESILFQFKDYRENIKFRYVFPLIESTSNILYQALIERFVTYTGDLSTNLALIDARQEDKARISERLTEMLNICRHIQDDIDKTRNDLSSPP